VPQSSALKSSLHEEQYNVLEVVKLLNSEHTLEQMKKNYKHYEQVQGQDAKQKKKIEIDNVLLFGKPSFFDTRCMVHQARFNQRMLDKE